MKKLLITLCLPLLLAGCLTAPDRGGAIVVPGGPTVITTDPGSITVSDPRIGQIQDVASRLCGFVPTASFIVKMFASAGGSVDAGLSLAQTICAAVTVAPKATSARSLRRPTINGIPIEGRFVK